MKETQYDDIPLEYIGKNILEVGVNTRILNSQIWAKIKQGDYLGIDIMIRNESKLNTIQANILDYEIKQKFDTILMIEVLEHIHLREWISLIDKLKNALIDDGYLIVSTPYKRTFKNYLGTYKYLDRFQVHTIFGINRQIMNHFFNGCKIKIIRTVLWRQDNAKLEWAIVRFLKRLLFGPLPFNRNIMIFWQKK